MATLVAVGAVALGLVLVGGPAAAQQGPPPCDQAYGCPPPPPPRPTSPTITVRPPQSQSGRVVGVDACGYRPTDDGLAGSITFDGEPVLAVTLDDDGCLRQGQPSNGLSNSFVVPDRPPGTYEVCSVFPGYAAACMTFRVLAPGGGNQGADTEVLDSETARGSDERVLAEGSERSRGLGSLARTGIGLGVLLAVALGLILGGRVLTSHRRSTGTDTADR